MLASESFSSIRCILKSESFPPQTRLIKHLFMIVKTSLHLRVKSNFSSFVFFAWFIIGHESEKGHKTCESQCVLEKWC